METISYLVLEDVGFTVAWVLAWVRHYSSQALEVTKLILSSATSIVLVRILPPLTQSKLSICNSFLLSVYREKVLAEQHWITCVFLLVREACIFLTEGQR